MSSTGSGDEKSAIILALYGDEQQVAQGRPAWIGKKLLLAGDETRWIPCRIEELSLSIDELKNADFFKKLNEKIAETEAGDQIVRIQGDEKYGKKGLTILIRENATADDVTNFFAEIGFAVIIEGRANNNIIDIHPNETLGDFSNEVAFSPLGENSYIPSHKRMSKHVDVKTYLESPAIEERGYEEEMYDPQDYAKLRKDRYMQSGEELTGRAAIEAAINDAFVKIKETMECPYTQEELQADTRVALYIIKNSQTGFIDAQIVFYQDNLDAREKMYLSAWLRPGGPKESTIVASEGGTLSGLAARYSDVEITKPGLR